jgi:hypothetical protein
LHERIFESDEEYNENAKEAIFSGYPFCPFERRVAFWITTENEKFINEAIQGLCFCCFMNGVYHKAMSVKGTELWEKTCSPNVSKYSSQTKKKENFSKTKAKPRKNKKKEWHCTI